MKNLIGLSIFATVVVFSSCGTPQEKQKEEMNEEPIEQFNDSTGAVELQIIPADSSASFPEAALMISEESLNGKDISFKFNVKNYELGVQTPGAVEKSIANSAKGQHIHAILDNGPYTARYEPNITYSEADSLEEGEHVLFSFLSRSFHESVKNQNPPVVTTFMIGENQEKIFDKEGQHLFYSRPKGTYSGEYGKKVLLDFYLYNTSISQDGNYVDVTVNGDFNTKIAEWKPYYILGLNKGTNTIQLALKDKDGNLIEGPFNEVTREIIIEE